MAGISFRCPNTGFRVYAWIEGEDSDANGNYETVTCAACQRVHLVNPKSDRIERRKEKSEVCQKRQRRSAFKHRLQLQEPVDHYDYTLKKRRHWQPARRSGLF